MIELALLAGTVCALAVLVHWALGTTASGQQVLANSDYYRSRYRAIGWDLDRDVVRLRRRLR